MENQKNMSTTMSTKLILGGKKIILLAGIFLLAASCTKNSQNQTVAVMPSPTAIATATPTPNPTSTEVDKSKVIYLKWTFKTLPSGKYDEPFSQIGLKLSGAVNKTVDLGKFSGCRISTQDAYPEKHNNQIDRLFCWWAGAGDDLTVLWNKPDELTIYREEMDENPEGTRYPPKLLKTIKIPFGLAVQMVTGE